MDGHISRKRAAYAALKFVTEITKHTMIDEVCACLQRSHPGKILVGIIKIHLTLRDYLMVAELARSKITAISHSPQFTGRTTIMPCVFFLCLV